MDIFTSLSIILVIAIITKMRRQRRHTIIVLIICICCSLAISVYLFQNDITSSGGDAMRDEGGGIQSINGYGGIFVSIILFYFLVTIIFNDRK
jgi:hypothetical protein